MKLETIVNRVISGKGSAERTGTSQSHPTKDVAGVRTNNGAAEGGGEAAEACAVGGTGCKGDEGREDSRTGSEARTRRESNETTERRLQTKVCHKSCVFIFFMCAKAHLFTEFIFCVRLMLKLKKVSTCRHDEMDRLVREKEASVAKVRESGLERERALQSTVRELSKRVEDVQGALRQSQWTQQDAQKENEATIERRGTIICLLCHI